MKQILMLDVPENAPIKPIETALEKYRLSLADESLFSAFFVDGLGHERPYNGFSIKMDEALVKDVQPITLEVEGGGVVELGFKAGLVTAVYLNPDLPPFELIPLTIYTRAANEGEPTCQ